MQRLPEPAPPIVPWRPVNRPPSAGTEQVTFYELFIEELDAITIMAYDNAVHVVGELTRAAKRAQLVWDDDLPRVEDR